MKFLALSGSTRKASSNTALLRALAIAAPHRIEVNVFEHMQQFPVFSPDLEGDQTPDIINVFCENIRKSDGLIVASPEYVRAIPGGLKNTIDWLVSRDEIINKPIVLAHASHRGDDMLQSLRTVLGTVSTRFNERIFLRIPLVSKTPEEVVRSLQEEQHSRQLRQFLNSFRDYIDQTGLVST
ncbi:MAG: NADPH-dependent FMN reductase [Granulosicoccus sp.]